MKGTRLERFRSSVRSPWALGAKTVPLAMRRCKVERSGADRNVPFAQVAFAAYVPHNYPIDTLEPGLNETAFYDPINFTYPAGAYIAEIEIDRVEGLNQHLEQRVADQVGEIERMSRLRRFLPPQVADLIVASGTEKQLESHRREITALFCDLRGFTGFSESADPEDVMALLREYHAAIGDSIITGVAPDPFAIHHHERVVYSFKAPVVAPGGEPAVNRPPWGQVVR